MSLEHIDFTEYDAQTFDRNGTNNPVTAEDLNNGVRNDVGIQNTQSVPLSTVETKPIKWLHPGRIPRGKITIMAGDPDVGKTFLTLDIAARVSTGNRWPDGSKNKAGNVLILSAEDDLADTIVPRLQSAEADLDRIHALTTVKDPKTDVEAIPTLTNDLHTIEKEIKAHQPRLMIIDPINAYLPGVDTHRDAELRTKVFAPLKKLAEDHDIAVICVMHLNKSSNQSAKHRVSGSIAYVAASRATWLITNDKDQHERKLMIPVKFNIGPKPDGMAYKIIPNEQDQPVIAWEKDPIEVDADEALSPDGSTAPERSEAQEFLVEILKDGPALSKQVIKEAGELNISERTLKRAKNKLGIISERIGKKGEQGGGKWYYKWPDS